MWGSPRLLGDCRVPRYRIGKFYKNTTSVVMFDISVQPEDLAPERLICLAGVLKQRYQAQGVSVGIFTSYKAALNYEVLGVEYPPNGVLWASKQHAQYHYNAEEHIDYLLLMPDGLNLDPSSPLNTRIDFPLSGKLSCRLEIGGRCLLEVDHIDLPTDALPASVTLTARILPSGLVADVNAVRSTGNPSAQEDALVSLAVRNLMSWRFENRLNDTAMRILYSVERVGTPLEHGVNVQFELPDRVKIQIGPMLLSR